MIGLITITAGGRAAAERLAAVLPYAHIYDGPAASALPLAFAECDAIISFLAVGATVRIAAPLITVAMSAIFLKERVRIYRWSAVTIGFAVDPLSRSERSQ